MVQLPAGRFAKLTDPIGLVQVGCVTTPTVRAAGIVGATIVADNEAADTHPF